MSGVIDENGVQWERCNSCSNFVRFDLLFFEQPSERYEFGRDLCEDCFYGKISPAEIQRRIDETERKRREYEESDDYKNLMAKLDSGIWVSGLPGGGSQLIQPENLRKVLTDNPNAYGMKAGKKITLQDL